MGGPERGERRMTRRKKCERERKKAERGEKSGKCALLVKPSDLCLVINKQFRGILVKESAVFNSQKPKLFASASASKHFENDGIE